MSNLIKSFQYVPVDDRKRLENHHHYGGPETEGTDSEVEGAETEALQARVDEETKRLTAEMLEDAKEFAEKQVREASEEAERMLKEAREQIDSWWQEQRQQDEHLIEAMRSQGFQQGFDEGKVQAELDLQVQIEQMMKEAQEVLQEAYVAKDQIIQEAEPFLVELACGIAEKVIDKQLTVEPEHTLELIRQNLSRKREQGMIALCVAPEQFAFVQAAREELSLSIDSQAELQILPDATVKDKGCVIRSSFGSVDARIDTQLSEIKKELVRIALEDEGRKNQHEGS
ncbi:MULTISPECIES: FliH/SctL family protein [Paenibacillus]|uniref:Flagellar biosynthesis-type III secretory pathway protein n=1 Tax=Paenibacillus illinoisensis TaxID=59845 RepID=A0A2W0C4K2_9BACL|nr:MULTISPECIES: FliH/SctL family protein [Paenibacillus]PAD32811.1 flagellar assembly protein FliH [Paenibacillus sp. 7523-1]PYY26784.1 Flagellar biosynthesis-type III secretory pathway protein [Paenibacillus illinoisensis]